MLNQLVSFSLRNRLLIAAAAVICALWATVTANTLSIDVLPDLNRPTVTIMTEAHAMVPEDVERLITRPLEQSLNGASGVARVRSSSGTGLSVVYVEFEWDTDIYRNRQIVQEKLQLASAQLPPDARPVMAPISSIVGQIQQIGLRSVDGSMSASDLRAWADVDVKYRLLSLPGVANVVSIGGAPRQLQIVIDTDRLRAFDLTMQDIGEAVRNSNRNSSGGILDIGTRGPVITVTGLVTEADQVADALIRIDGDRPIRVRDVARVEFGPAAVRTGEAGVDGDPGVIMIVFKQVGADTVKLTEAIDRELESLQAGVAGRIRITGDLFKQADFIDRAIANVSDAVIDGGILVVVVLFVFLMNFQTTFITLTAIPLSIALTVLVFSAFGLSINTMTLGGLAVAIGALVDDAIVGLENIYRRLRQNSGRRDPEHELWVIFKAVSEVRRPIVIGTLLVMVVYIPLFFLSGLEGRLFTPIGITYILAVGCSLLVSLTVTPVLCHWMLARRDYRDRRDTPVVRIGKSITDRVIRFGIRHSREVLGVLLALVIACMMILVNRGTQFLPEFNEGSAQINLELPPETGLTTSDEYGRRLEDLLMSVEGVVHVGRRTGRAEGDEHAMGVSINEAIITFDPKSERSREEIIADLRERIALEFPGVSSSVDQPLSHLLSHMLSGVKAQVAVKVFGPELHVLRRAADEIRNLIEPIDGVEDLYVEPQVLIDRIAITPRRDRLAHFGLTVDDIAESIELALGGEPVSRMTVGTYTYPVTLRLDPDDRRHLGNIREFPVRDGSGTLIRLEDVARVELVKTPNNINRENVSRRIVVQHNVGGRPLGDVVADVRRAIGPVEAKLSQQPGYSIRISGQFEAQEAAQDRIAMLSIAALAVMGLILHVHFGSANFVIQVLMSLPMAFVGAIAAILITGQSVSIATLVGLISLGGIAARNTILLIDHYIHLMREEGEPFGIECIVRAGQERMVPVVMTALTSGIALVPIALSAGEPGREILYPVATVIIGGLVSSTLLDFLVSPALFWLFGRRAAERLAAKPLPADAATISFENEFNQKPETS